MEYFVGLDVSMAETHVYVVTGNGRVVHNANAPRVRATANARNPPISATQPLLREWLFLPHLGHSVVGAR